MRRNAGRTGLVLATLALLHAPAAQAETKNVLVLFSNARLLPANVEVEGALRETLAESKGGPVEVFAEFLDSPRFGGGSYATTMATYLREKYASRPPSAIVVAGAEALGFLLRNRGELFPEAPIVHVAVSRSSLQALQPLPANVVGVPGDFDFAGTIALALRLHSRARRVVVVTGASLQDRGYEAQARSALPQFAGRASVEFLSGLPTAALLERVKTLSPDAVVFTAGYFEDGDGRMFTPRAAAEGLARMSAVPVYAPFNTFLGTGIVGGRMPTFEAIGRQAGEIVATLLGGVALSSLRLPEAVPTAVHLDWRQARRWGIRDRDVPAGTVWHFREPTLWQSHRNWLIAAAAALLIQAALIAGLLVQSRRRREAVLASEQDRLRLVRASRLALAGELTGSIAHEINQPLGAILSNAAAARAHPRVRRRPPRGGPPDPRRHPARRPACQRRDPPAAGAPRRERGRAAAVRVQRGRERSRARPLRGSAAKEDDARPPARRFVGHAGRRPHPAPAGPHQPGPERHGRGSGRARGTAHDRHGRRKDGGRRGGHRARPWLQADVIAAVAPFTVETGDSAAFVTTPDDPVIDPALIAYVSAFVPKGSGENFNPHVTTGVAPREYLDKMVAEPFKAFTFSPASAAVYQLGQFGTVAKKLKDLELKR